MKLLKENLDKLSYDDILANRFRDLEVHKSEWCGEITVSCTFTMSKAVWDSYRKIGSLGQIYNCDLSNYLSRRGLLNFYAVPTVNDERRAVKGIKTITVKFVKRRE